jgi:hypothetical protein
MEDLGKILSAEFYSEEFMMGNKDDPLSLNLGSD